MKKSFYKIWSDQYKNTSINAEVQKMDRPTLNPDMPELRYKNLSSIKSARFVDFDTVGEDDDTWRWG